MKSILSLLCVFSLGAAALASITEEGGGIIFGTNHVFSLKAPKGWMLDNESAVKQGVHAVFYPKGSSWKEGRVVAYAQARGTTEKIKTAADTAKATIDEFHENGSPKYQGKLEKTLKADGGREAAIYHFSGDKWGNFEAVAYMPELKTINYIVLTARTEKEFKEALPAFEALAKSYTYIGDQFNEEGNATKKKAPAAPEDAEAPAPKK